MDKKLVIYFFAILNILNVAFAGYIMPDEGDPHTATWMAYGATTWTWGTRGYYGVSRMVARKDLIRIAANVARFENVKMLINDGDQAEANTFLAQVRNEDYTINTNKVLPPMGTTYNIEFVEQPVDDLWARDTAPVFIYDNNVTKGINFNFNGWGQENTGAAGWTKDATKASNGVADQVITYDKKIADFIIKRVGVTEINTWLVLEGGGFDVNGKGTAVATESCILNNNRNPGKSKSDVEAEFLRLLGIQKVIWLPGLKAMDITDGHVDFYARFVNDTTVVCYIDNDKTSAEYAVTQQNYQILSASTDLFGKKLTVVNLTKPNSVLVRAAVISRNEWTNIAKSYNPDAFASSYIGYYMGSGFVIMAKFGDTAADTLAFNTLSSLYPTRVVMQITTDGISNGGGSIHCATQQQTITPKTATFHAGSFINIYVLLSLVVVYRLSFC